MAVSLPPHPFYAMPWLARWIAALTLGLGSLAGLIAIQLLAIRVAEPLGTPGIIGASAAVALAALALLPALQTACTPMLTLLGMYRYVHPVVMLMPMGQGRLDLHSGTLFDLAAHLPRGTAAGRRRWLMSAYLDGLLALCDAVEDQRIPADTRFAATSHFFSPSVAHRLSLPAAPAPLVHRIALGLLYADLVAMASFVERRPSFPRLTVARLEFTGAQLVQQRHVVQQIADRVRPSAGPRE